MTRNSSRRFVRYSAAVNAQIENSYLRWVNGTQQHKQQHRSNTTTTQQHNDNNNNNNNKINRHYVRATYQITTTTSSPTTTTCRRCVGPSPRRSSRRIKHMRNFIRSVRPRWALRRFADACTAPCPAFDLQKRICIYKLSWVRWKQAAAQAPKPDPKPPPPRRAICRWAPKRAGRSETWPARRGQARQ